MRHNQVSKESGKKLAALQLKTVVQVKQSYGDLLQKQARLESISSHIKELEKIQEVQLVQLEEYAARPGVLAKYDLMERMTSVEQRLKQLKNEEACAREEFELQQQDVNALTEKHKSLQKRASTEKRQLLQIPAAEWIDLDRQKNDWSEHGY